MCGGLRRNKLFIETLQPAHLSLLKLLLESFVLDSSLHCLRQLLQVLLLFLQFPAQWRSQSEFKMQQVLQANLPIF